jgi:hypothetical protein
MRRLWICIFAGALEISAAELSGYISDAACGWNNARSAKEAKECAQKCVKAGWDPVFVPDGKRDVYKFRDKSKVLPFVGDHVAISGKLQGDHLAVSVIRRTPAPQHR